MGTKLNQVLRDIENRKNKSLKTSNIPNQRKTPELIPAAEVQKIVGNIKKVFEDLFNTIPETKIQEEDPNDRWSYERDITSINPKCEKEIRELRNQLIGQHSVLLQFVRENDISQDLMTKIVYKMRRWESKTVRNIRRELVEEEYNELMEIIKHPIRAKMER